MISAMNIGVTDVLRPVARGGLLCVLPSARDAVVPATTYRDR